MLAIDQKWTSTGSSGALATVRVYGGPVEGRLYIERSTASSGMTVQFQTAQESTGPWFVVASTTFTSTLASQTLLSITGPLRYVRPFFVDASTGQYNLRYIAETY